MREADTQTQILELSAEERRWQHEGELEYLRWKAFYGQFPKTAGDTTLAEVTALTRFVIATSDGFLTVIIDGKTESLPSGLQVTLNGTTAGRDNGVIDEGVWAGKAFNVKTGHLVAQYPRYSDLQVSSAKRVAGPVIIGEESYDLEVRLSYKDASGKQKSAGPFPALTDPDNPVPPGSYALEIADYAHKYGLPYPPYGTVWFRIRESVGNRYLHAGRVSEGCLTCDPGAWTQIYEIVHRARVDSKRAGTFTMS